MRRLSARILLGLIVGCSNKDAPVNPSKIQPMLGAVMHSETDEVRRLAVAHIGLDERDPADQSTPVIAPAQTDQWTRSLKS